MAKPARRTAHPRDWEEGVEFMRKYRYLAIAAAGVMVIGASAGTALAAPAKSSPVLRIGSTHGAAVKNGAKVGASLAKGQKVQFTVGSLKATCPKSSFAAKVVKNPSAKGKASLSITSETLSGCALVKPIAGLTFKSVIALNLPAPGVITSKGTLGVSEAKASKPLGFTSTVDFNGGTIVCVFTAKSGSGKANNKNHTVTFGGTFSLNKSLTPAGSLPYCTAVGTSSSFSATYGPITDNSVKHHPKVYVG
jgi:hypothetical protein